MTQLPLMLRARRQTQAQLDCLIRQIEARALRRVVRRRTRRRSSPGNIPWSREDERAYQAEIDALSFEHLVVIEALARKLDRQDRAIDIITRRQDHARIHA